MANSEQIRANVNQHTPKNTKSKKDDKSIYQAQQKVMDYLYNRFEKELKDNYYLQFDKSISFELMQHIINQKNIRHEFEMQYNDRTIKPDGGIILLKKHNDTTFNKVVLIAEVKRQGTNDARTKEGKKKQAQGNAVERLGKNLIGIRAMLNHERVTPFICFFWGCDFGENETYIPSKVCMLNEFYECNRSYVYKRDGNSDNNSFSPVSMYYQENQWDVENMYNIMKEIAETAIRYYLY